MRKATIRELHHQEEEILTLRMETDDLFGNSCEYGDGIMTLFMQLKRPSPVRTSLFKFLIENEASEPTLIPYDSEVFYIEEWELGNALFKFRKIGGDNINRQISFILTGLQVRYSAAINQGETVHAIEKKKASR